MPIQSLIFTTLYPNHVQVRHGVFIETRIRKLAAQASVALKVVAPVPWFPIDAQVFGTYGTFAKIAAREERYGIDVWHPRFPVVPKVGPSLTPFLLACRCYPVLRRLLRSGFDFDLIDAHYYYPDGVAAVLLGKALRKPVAITARGSDINLIPQSFVPNCLIRWAMRETHGNAGVSQALVAAMQALEPQGVPYWVLRNGVDRELFRPQEPKDASLGFRLLSVGNLVDLKGHDLVIEAAAQLPDVEVTIIGEGERKTHLVRQAAELGIADRVHFFGNMTQPELVQHYSMADCLVLASSREGWPNVLLEAMACGTPVIATHVGGIPEIIKDSRVGHVLEERSAESIARTVAALRTQSIDRDYIRDYTSAFGWEDTVQQMLAFYEQVLSTFKQRCA